MPYNHYQLGPAEPLAVSGITQDDPVSSRRGSSGWLVSNRISMPGGDFRSGVVDFTDYNVNWADHCMPRVCCNSYAPYIVPSAGDFA